MLRKIAAAISLIAMLALAGCGWGRTPSRYLGKDHRQVVEVKHMKKLLNISFDKRGDETVKDITYEATDGYVYTHEYKDSGMWEGAIRWVPANHDASTVRSRAISRWFGTPVELRLPEDCKEVLGATVTYASKSERVKNLLYRSTDGNIYAKEYRDGMLDRHLEGWMEIKPVE